MANTLSTAMRYTVRGERVKSQLIVIHNSLELAIHSIFCFQSKTRGDVKVLGICVYVIFIELITC